MHDPGTSGPVRFQLFVVLEVRWLFQVWVDTCEPEAVRTKVCSNLVVFPADLAMLDDGEKQLLVIGRIDPIHQLLSLRHRCGFLWRGLN